MSQFVCCFRKFCQKACSLRKFTSWTERFRLRTMAPVVPAKLSEAIENYINSNKVMVFSRSTCPFCVKVKSLFGSLGVDYFSLELDQHENMKEMQNAMAAKAGRSSVPQVFINGKHVGGCDDTMAAHKSGKLQEMLKSSQPKNYSAILIDYIKSNPVMIFSKSTCPFCLKVKDLIKSLGVQFLAVEIDLIEGGENLHAALVDKVGKTSVPQVFVNGTHIGGYDDTVASHSSGNLQKMLNLQNENYDYDLAVIGGGSGGLAASKEAARLGKKVVVFDFVQPTPVGTSWGLGGTCVNVGCIPKKLMHQAALLGHSVKEASKYGWNVPDSINHSWTVMKDAIQDHIRSLNWNYRVQLRTEQVQYMNSYVSFVEPHKLKTVDKKDKETFVTAKDFIIATGERPRYPDLEGAREYGITSDDLFSLSESPGKTLVIGASYVALECAGFLAALGIDVTVMVRSILLRGFDQDMAEQIGSFMQINGVKFLRPCIPIKIQELDAGPPRTLKVAGQMGTDDLVVGEYNTILFAIGRDACTKDIGLEKIGVKVNVKNGKIPVTNEQSNVSHVYAVGDVLEGRPELTPVAIEAGMLLARRLYGNSTIQCDYNMIPTTVFTPLEYGSLGCSEEDAIKLYTDDNIEVYHAHFTPLEWTVPKRPENTCYAKIVCLKTDNERIIGFHYLGPNAGEVTQGFALGMKKGATKADLDSVIGIHPTCAEIFTTLKVTKRSGDSTLQAGC